MRVVALAAVAVSSPLKKLSHAIGPLSCCASLAACWVDVPVFRFSNQLIIFSTIQSAPFSTNKKHKPQYGISQQQQRSIGTNQASIPGQIYLDYWSITWSWSIIST
jgi:hypothetical protein